MIRKFLSYYKPHMRLFILDMVSAVIVAACALFYPLITKEMINNYVPNENLSMIITSALFLLGIYLIKALCTYIMGYYGHVVGVRMQAHMRRDLFCKYEKLPFSYFDDHKTGDLLSRLTNDLQDISELAHHGPENLLLGVLMLVGAFVVLSGIDVLLTLIMFAVVPFIVLFTVISRKRMRDAMTSSRRQMAAINTTLENSITGIRETKAYVAGEHEIKKFNVANGLFAKFRSRAMFSLGFFDSIMQFLQDLLYLVIILAGGLFLYYDRIDPGEFAAFILYTSMFLTPIQRFTMLFTQLQEGMSGYSRFYELICEDEEIDNGKTELSEVSGHIRFEDVSFGYGDTNTSDKLVISELNLDIPAGKTLALVGPSGGGKTTLCNLIPRFYNVTGGKITLDGVDISDITLDSLRSNIGIVSQNVFLFDGTVRENIAYGKEVSDEELILAAKRANIHDFICTLDKGYDTEVGERGVKLSGGQKQRIAIARVFLKNPKLLILDEATSALDNATEMQIQASLEELSRGRTVIVVAHRLSTVKGADEIVVIDTRGVVERGTHEELIELDGEYKKLYLYQFRES